MTYRERKERRAERRAEWARKRKAKSEAAFSAVPSIYSSARTKLD